MHQYTSPLLAARIHRERIEAAERYRLIRAARSAARSRAAARDTAESRRIANPDAGRVAEPELVRS
jgi:hypothetical protein